MWIICRGIFSNYFLDEFLVTDYSGNVYILTKQEITAYPDGDINPKQEITFKFFDLPIDREQIMMIAVNLGGRNNIVLKRIPKPKIPE